MLRTIGINILVLFGFIIALELVFGTWFSKVHALHQFTKPRDLRIERENPLSDTLPTVVYTRDVNGFRGLTGPVSQIDILTVGGSTTDQRFLDDSETYQAVLTRLFEQKGRTVSVANAGIDGQSTYGHIENFQSWFDLIDGLQVRYILFYVGVNDMLIIGENDTYDRIRAQSPRLRLQLFIREKSVFYQLYLIVKNAYLSPNLRHTLNTQNFALGDDLVVQPGLTSDDFKESQALMDLSDRIVQLAELTKEMGAIPIFVTQRSTTWTRRNGKVMGVPEITGGFLAPTVARFGSVNGIDMYRIEREVADAIMSGCRRAEAECFDLMADLDFDLSRDFYDEIHTTSSGSERIAEYLHDRLSAMSGF